MLAVPCATERAGCAIATISSTAVASVVLIFKPMRFMLSFLLAHGYGRNLVCRQHLLPNLDAQCGLAAIAYAIGSTAPASRNARSRRTQLSQTPQASVSPE